jgi:hypothetical protein
MCIHIRLIHLEDIPTLGTLIPESARKLQANYSPQNKSKEP